MGNETTIKIILPLPPDCLRPNARKHWRAKAAAAKRSRADASLGALIGIAASDAQHHKWTKPVAQATFYFKTRARRDADNLVAWLKSTIDGIADGLQINDRDLAFLPNKVEFDKADPRLEIVVTESQ